MAAAVIAQLGVFPDDVIFKPLVYNAEDSTVTGKTKRQNPHTPQTPHTIHTHTPHTPQSLDQYVYLVVLMYLVNHITPPFAPPFVTQSTMW